MKVTRKQRKGGRKFVADLIEENVDVQEVQLRRRGGRKFISEVMEDSSDEKINVILGVIKPTTPILARADRDPQLTKTVSWNPDLASHKIISNTDPKMVLVECFSKGYRSFGIGDDNPSPNRIIKNIIDDMRDNQSGYIQEEGSPWYPLDDMITCLEVILSGRKKMFEKVGGAALSRMNKEEQFQMLNLNLQEEAERMREIPEECLIAVDAVIKEAGENNFHNQVIAQMSFLLNSAKEFQPPVMESAAAQPASASLAGAGASRLADQSALGQARKS